ASKLYVARDASQQPRLAAEGGETSGMLGTQVLCRDRVCARLFCLSLATAICILLSTPAQTRALDAQLRWRQSTDTRVEGYHVYVREATKPYGAPIDAGAARPASGGTLDWVVTGLSSNTTYFMAVSAYTSDGLESALSNELPLGS